MRIAFHSPRASFLGAGASGDHVLVSSLLTALRGRGHRVAIVSRLDVRDTWRGRVSTHRLLLDTLAARRRMRRFSPDAWLVYTPSVTYPDLLGWWQRPARYVLFAADKGRPERLPRRWRWLFAFAHQRSLRRADAVGVYRPRSAERLRSMGVPGERIHLLPPVAPMWDSPPSRAQARETLGLPADRPIVLCVTRFAERKDGRPAKTEIILNLLDAAASLPSDVLVLVVGDGPGRDQIEGRARTLGLDSRVQLAGAVQHEQIASYFAACDVFAYPYDLDRPWATILEAQAAGRPVVTMRTDSAEITVEDGRTGLLAGDFGEFRTQLAELLGDRDRCGDMGRAAREYVHEFHSVDVRARQIEELLRTG